MKTTEWKKIRNQKLSKTQQDSVDKWVETELVEMDLRALREVLNKTQEDVADIVGMTQSEVSRLERRSDHRLSTLKRIVKALGGNIEVVATFGDKRVRLRSTG